MTGPALIFDLGKVLVDFDYRQAAKQIARRAQSSPDVIRKLIDQSHLLHRFEMGQISSEQFFDEVRTVTGFDGSLEEFAPLFADIFVPVDEMIELHREVKAQGFLTYVLSNTNALAVGHIRRAFPFFAHFDDYIFSFEHGAMKPDERIYRVVEDLTGRNGADLIFIDDREENLLPAAALGWRTILQETPARTRAHLAELGVVR